MKHYEDVMALAAEEAKTWRFREALLRRSDVPMASFLTGTNTELIYASTASGTAKNTFTAEVAINDTAGMGVQAHLPPDFWLPNKAQSVGKGIRIFARGLVSSTGTPTYTWTVRGGAAGAVAGAILSGSAALATASGIANAPWWFDSGDIILEAIGAAGANSTIRSIGSLLTDGYSAATTTRVFALYGGAATPGTATTFDTSITNYINFNIACSASNAANTITLQQLLVYGLN